METIEQNYWMALSNLSLKQNRDELLSFSVKLRLCR